MFLKATLGRTLVRGRREGDWAALFCKKRRCGVGAEVEDDCCFSVLIRMTSFDLDELYMAI